MRRSIAAAVFLIVAVVAGCATGTPTVDMEPVTAQPDAPPLWWFADTWGPFEVVEAEGGLNVRSEPMFLVDGERVFPARERARVMLDHILEGPGFEGSPGEFEEVRLFRHRCDKMLFGEAGSGGIVMAFSPEYEGPRPGPDAGHTYEVSREHPPGETCHRESP